MDKTNIRYTGLGARKNGNHTRKQFLSIMNKNFKNDCSTYIKSLSCNSCKKLDKRCKTKKINSQTLKLLRQCRKCKNANIKHCDSAAYKTDIVSDFELPHKDIH